MRRYLVLLTFLSMIGAAAVPALAQSPPGSTHDSIDQAAVAVMAERGVSLDLLSRVLSRISEGGAQDSSAVVERTEEWVDYVAAHIGEFERTPSRVMERWLNSDPTMAVYAAVRKERGAYDQGVDCLENYTVCTAAAAITAFINPAAGALAYTVCNAMLFLCLNRISP